MMPLPSRLPVPYGNERRDAAADYAKLELRDGGAWILASVRGSRVRPVRKASAVRPVGTWAKVAHALGAFFL